MVPGFRFPQLPPLEDLQFKVKSKDPRIIQQTLKVEIFTFSRMADQFINSLLEMGFPKNRA